MATRRSRLTAILAGVGSTLDLSGRGSYRALRGSRTKDGVRESDWTAIGKDLAKAMGQAKAAN